MEIAHGRPVPAGHFTMGGAFTPDGRVLLYGDSAIVHQEGGWSARVLRHESLVVDSFGVPNLNAASWSNPVQFAFDSIPVPGGMSAQPSPDVTAYHGWISVGADPDYASFPVPFPSDATGSYVAQASAGQVMFETYRLVIVSPMWWPMSVLDLANPQFALGSHLYMVMAKRRLQVVVGQPRTGNAFVHSAQLLDAAPTPMTYTAGGAEHAILGAESSITLDGRLLVFNQGGPSFIGNRIMYSFNQAPFAGSGWSVPRQLNEMHAAEASTVVAGVRFADRYPLAKQPLLDGANQPVTGQYWGAYPWISMDGTDIVHTTCLFINPPVPNTVRSGLAIIGQSTGWKLQHIDGPLNADRNTTQRFVFTGTGNSPGIWSPARDMNRPPLPYGRHGHSVPLFGIDPGVYGEVSIEERLDGDYVVALPLNEAVIADPAGNLCWQRDVQQTPDLCSNKQTGLLQSGASFPQEIGLADNNHGIIGQAVSFDSHSVVRVDTTGPANGAKNALTVEFFLEDPSIAPAPVPSPRSHKLAQHVGSWSVVGDENGSVLWSVVTTAGTRFSRPVPGIRQGKWTHLAMTYEATTGGDSMQCFVDGVLVSTSRFPSSGPLGVAAPSGPLLLGPNGEHLPNFGEYGGRYMLDEFKYSRVKRTAEEISRHARAVPAPVAWAPSPTLPIGLKAEAARIPTDHPFTAAAVNLGNALFHDPALSANGQMSCATCHRAAMVFTDGQVLATGHMGQRLPRNTPTVVNRLFSTVQLLDGRASSLEVQSLMPINDPTEMASSTAAAVAYLRGSAYYNNQFQTVYGSLPNAELLARALASYQRALVSGGSPFDAHAAGGPALSGSALAGHDLFFGKARCFSCHYGTNFTDEAFHVTLVNDGDLGRTSVTGRVRDGHRFKTPTLRNVDSTGPYFHDGSVSTLAEVVHLYSIGGARTDVVDSEIRPLGLTPGEQADLVRFLQSLTGSVTLLQP
ncbi:MAG: cytochrome c peroxidase [Planctomycetota bacterium]